MNMNTMEFQHGESESSPVSNIEAMLRNERTVYANGDYFARFSQLTAPRTLTDSIPVDPSCRSTMAKWCNDMCKFCDYDRSLVASVMSCVDRFVATPEGLETLSSRSEYQLVVATCWYLVSKIHETKAMSSSSISKLLRGMHSTEDVEAMERKILVALEWRVINAPTSLRFAHDFFRTFRIGSNNRCDDNDNYEKHEWEWENDGNSSEETRTTTASTEERLAELVRCQLDEATGDYALSCLYQPSRVAFAALWNALESLGIHIHVVHVDSVDSSSSGVGLLRLGETLGIREHEDWVDVHRASAALLRLVSSLDESRHRGSLGALLVQCYNNNNNNSNLVVGPVPSRRSSSGNFIHGSRTTHHQLAVEACGTITSSPSSVVLRTISSLINSSTTGTTRMVHYYDDNKKDIIDVLIV